MGSSFIRQKLDNSYSIGSVARLTGLSQFTLRAWESRYTITQPKRAANGRRMYSDGDIKRLTLLRLLTERGHAISDIASYDADRLTALLERGTERGPASDHMVDKLESALAHLELGEFGSVLRAAQLRYDTRTLLLYVLAPFMRRLGARVADGSMDIFHEHAASAVVRNLLTGLLYSAERANRPRGERPILFATPEGDFHEFGILIAAVLSLLNGRSVFYLGANTPASSLARAAVTLKSELAVVAVTAPESELAASVLNQFFRDVGKALPGRCALWLAGPRASAVKKSISNAHSILSFDDFERRLRSARKE